MATKKYLDYAGLKRVLAKLLPGARKIWHGTLAEWEALSATEKAKYDQAEVIDEYTGVPVVVDKVESGNLNPVTSNAVAAVNMDSDITVDTTKWSPAGQVHALKIGQLGFIRWGGNAQVDISTNVNNRTKVAQLSAGFRPNQAIDSTLMTIGGTVAAITLNAAGEVLLCSPSDTLKVNNWAWGQIVFVIGN